MPVGPGALAFFCWKKPGTTLSTTEVRALAEILLAEPSTTNLAAARAVANTVRYTQEDVKLFADALRQQIPVLRVLLTHLPLVNAMAAALVIVDIDELEARLNEAVMTTLTKAFTKRGKVLLQLGLAGAFSGLERR